MTATPDTIEQDSRYERSSGQVSRNVAGETMVVPVRGGVGDLDSIYMLRGVGHSVWEMIGEGRTVEEMVKSIETEFDVEHDRALRDLHKFLHDLLAEGLIRKRS